LNDFLSQSLSAADPFPMFDESIRAVAGDHVPGHNGPLRLGPIRAQPIHHESSSFVAKSLLWAYPLPICPFPLFIFTRLRLCADFVAKLAQLNKIMEICQFLV
jgi:hypothetical protein